MLHILDLLQLFLLQGVPLLYVPLEVIMSKYYGESERMLGNVFSLANELQNGAIIFLDEVHCTLFKTKLHMLNWHLLLLIMIVDNLGKKYMITNI